MSDDDLKKQFLAEIRQLVGGDRSLASLNFMARDSATAKGIANAWAIMALGQLEDPVDLCLLENSAVVWSRSFGPAL